MGLTVRIARSGIGRGATPGRATLYYSLARLGLFVVTAGILWVAGVDNLLLVLVLGVLLSGVLSYVVLAPQREAMAGGVVRRQQQRLAEKRELRKALDDDPR